MAKVLQVASGAIYAGLEAQFLNGCIGLDQHSEHDVRALLFHNNILATRLRQENIAIDIVPVGFDNYKQSVASIRSIVQNEKFDIVHSHGYKANIAVAKATRDLDGLIRVRTEHGLAEPFSGWKKLKFKLYDYLDRRIAAKQTDQVLAVSGDVHKYLTRFLPPEKVTLLPNCVAPAPEVADAQQDDLRTELGVSLDDHVLSIIGRLVPVKNHILFIDLVGELAKTNPNIKGLIVGDGPLRETLENYCRANNLTDRIIFAGFRSDIRIILAITKLLVFSSLHEGLPIVLLEAMSQGTPVAAVSVGGLTEVLGRYCPEVLAKSHDLEELTQVTSTVLNDPNLQKELATRGRNEVEQTYSIEAYAQSLSLIYSRLLERS